MGIIREVVVIAMIEMLLRTVGMKILVEMWGIIVVSIEMIAMI